MAEIVQASFAEGRTGYKAEKEPVAAEYNVNANHERKPVNLSQNLHGSSFQKDFGVQGHVRGIYDKPKYNKTQPQTETNKTEINAVGEQDEEPTTHGGVCPVGPGYHGLLGIGNRWYSARLQRCRRHFTGCRIIHRESRGCRFGL